MAIRNKKKGVKCFSCKREIGKGCWVHIHDNIENSLNPKVFCTQKCKLDYIFGISHTIPLEHFV